MNIDNEIKIEGSTNTLLALLAMEPLDRYHVIAKEVVHRETTTIFDLFRLYWIYQGSDIEEPDRKGNREYDQKEEDQIKHLILEEITKKETLPEEMPEILRYIIWAGDEDRIDSLYSETLIQWLHDSYVGARVDLSTEVLFCLKRDLEVLEYYDGSISENVKKLKRRIQSILKVRSDCEEIREQNIWFYSGSGRPTHRTHRGDEHTVASNLAEKFGCYSLDEILSKPKEKLSKPIQAKC